MNICCFSDLLNYLDQPLQEVDQDAIFASAYIRGFIDLLIAEFNVEAGSTIEKNFILTLEQKMQQAKSELSPQDQTLVNNFWLQTKALISQVC